MATIQTNSTSRGKTVWAALIGMGLLLSGCGTKGALEAPPAYNPKVDGEVKTDKPGQSSKPNRPFILDALL